MIKQWSKLLPPSLILLIATSNGFAEQGYRVIDSPQTTGDKVQVIEFFWYGCPHCYDFEPYLENWLESKPEHIEFSRMPAILGKHWIAHAQAFYVAESLNVLDKIHQPLFDALHKDNEKIYDEKSLKRFFVAQGVDGDEFTRAFNSAATAKKIKNAIAVGKRYTVTGVPAVVVNGKYVTGSSMTKNHAETIKVIDKLTAPLSMRPEQIR